VTLTLDHLKQREEHWAIVDLIGKGGHIRTVPVPDWVRAVEKTMAAPVTVIIAYDLKFYDKVPRLFPHYPAMRDMFVKNPQLIQETALRNSTLQGAYMILAARALGLDCGPMSGFDNAKLDEEFFAAGKCESCEQEFFPEGDVKSNFLCNIGYGDSATLMPRGPRLDFNEACTLL
jgi:3-hydroxypropanoate dehydrogenase